ncbi:hypothetical protein, conserved [Babesia ovata]|uniref:6-Cys domain-containing protein n=1 Tax=Babesia ovata TaxID=189622 RepID=A0A2H6KHM0_9APIC|nr:uncharacterized protein BOVATA_039640 [Babesia ovata]GBE62471.1 hypothetical protein, conserved [Babesia ovata]
MPLIAMGGLIVMKYMLALCAILLHSVKFIETSVCDYGDPPDLLRNNAIVSCHTYMEFFGFPPVICPRVVNDTEYVWHPQPKSVNDGYLNAYVGDNGKLSSVAISTVVKTDRHIAFVSVQSNRTQTQLYFDIPMNEFFSITERRLMFICGPKDLVMSDALLRHLERFNGVVQMLELPWSSSTPLTQEISKMGKGLGIYLLLKESMHLPLKGCGSRPSPLFDADGEVTVDPVTGVRSCVVDPMSMSRIGFLCEGRIEPNDCMRSLLDKNGGLVTAHPPHRYWKFDNYRPWVIAQYFEKLAFRPFNGECKCIDPETGQVKARIEIRSKADYVCDITSKIFRNRLRPIRGPWCSVVLHPGSTLTIRFPIEEADTETSEEESLPGLPSQNPPRYLFKTEFLPKDLNTLRQLTTIYDDIYGEVMYHKAIAGDALEWDVSKISVGEIKLKYLKNKPLALIRGLNSFFYYWTLTAINKYIFGDIRAILTVSFAFTHYYKTVGCERGAQKVFDPAISKKHCSTKRWGSDIGQTYECTYNKNSNILWAGIHCRENEELMPGNCESVGYDLQYNRIMPFRGSLRNATVSRVLGFQLLRSDFRNNNPVSFACVCVDQRGYEKSRLVFEQSQYEHYMYDVRQEEVPITSVRRMLVPWREAGSSSDGMTPPGSLMIHHAPQRPMVLYVGTSLVLRCAVARDAQYDANHFEIRPIWLPLLHEYYHYTPRNTTDGTELVHTAHGDSMTTTQGGFEVFTMMSTPTIYELGIKSHRGAIIISKHPVYKKYMPMTFVCGKYPKPSDISVIGGDVSSPAIPYIAASSARYTWNVVEVKVETTDPYMQGCGVTYASDELFKTETPKLYDSDGKQKIGCKIDLQTARKAAFHCPAPYVLDPPNCFSQVFVDGEVKSMSDLSKSLVASRSSHFVILRFDRSRVVLGETLRQTPPLECRCVTVKGIVLSTIQIENYYSKY